MLHGPNTENTLCYNKKKLLLKVSKKCCNQTEFEKKTNFSNIDEGIIKTSFMYSII